MESREMTEDSVCGMSVDEKTVKFRSIHQGRMFYFCSQRCRDSF
ncbi:MAG: YHS domain-containing protein [Candidatus Bathyarchaeia archaeon]